MALNFRRRQDVASIPDWHQDKAVLDTRARIAELADAIAASKSALEYQHSPAIQGAEERLHRKELEVLAGRANDSDLAVAQKQHLEARMLAAKEQIALEDAIAEKAKLGAALPAIERKAKLISHAAIQSKGVSLLKELRDGSAKVQEAEANYNALLGTAADQFPAGQGDHHAPHFDPTGTFRDRAGLGYITHSQFNQGRNELLTLDGVTERFRSDIEALLKSLGAAE